MSCRKGSRTGCRCRGTETEPRPSSGLSSGPEARDAPSLSPGQVGDRRQACTAGPTVRVGGDGGWKGQRSTSHRHAPKGKHRVRASVSQTVPRTRRVSTGTEAPGRGRAHLRVLVPLNHVLPAAMRVQHVQLQAARELLPGRTQQVCKAETGTCDAGRQDTANLLPGAPIPPHSCVTWYGS